MSRFTPQLVVLHEHPGLQEPLFAALARRAVAAFNVAHHAYPNVDAPAAALYFA